MFDIGFIELVVVACIGLIVIGPEKLPHTIRMIRAWITRFKITMNDIQVELEKELETEDLKKRLEKAEEKSGLKIIKHEVENDLKLLKESISQEKNSSEETSTPVSKDKT